MLLSLFFRGGFPIEVALLVQAAPARLPLPRQPADRDLPPAWRRPLLAGRTLAQRRLPHLLGVHGGELPLLLHLRG